MPILRAKTERRFIHSIAATWPKRFRGSEIPEGGVAGYGVECPCNIEVGDVARAKMKVQNVHRFCWLKMQLPAAPSPARQTRVRNHIASVDENGDGFVATLYSPVAAAPLMTTTSATIFISVRDPTMPAPYSVLVGMFGPSAAGGDRFDADHKQLAVLENSEVLISYPSSIDSPPKNT